MVIIDEKKLFMRRIITKSKSILFGIIFFLLCPFNGLVAEKLGEWYLQAGEDRFGDPTGENYYVQKVIGEGRNSIGSTSTQSVGIIYFPDPNAVGIVLVATNGLGLPLNMLFMGTEPITLYIKDSSNKTYEFSGTQVSDDGAVSIVMNDASSIVGLLRRKGSYKAVVEGDNWRCSFTFNGGMPQ